MSRLVKLVLVAAMLGVTSFIVTRLTMQPGPSGQLGPSVSAIASPSVSHTVAPAQDPLMYRGHSFTADTEPTASKGQSKLWYHDGEWWGILIGAGTEEYRVHRLDWETQTWVDTGVLVDERTSSHADVLAVENQLYVVSVSSGRAARHHMRILRYAYDDIERTYRLDPDFPVRVSNTGGRSATIGRDTLGRLWVAYIERGRLLVTRTDGNDHVWDEPAVPATIGTDGVADHVVLIAFAGSVGIVWSNEAEDAVYYAFQRDEDEEERWIGASVVVDGLDEADDHLDVRVIDEDTSPRLFVAVKTSLDEALDPNPAWEQVVLLVLEPDQTWSRHLFGTLHDRHTRPLLVIDEEARQLYMIATSRSGGRNAIYYKRTSVDAIYFEPGLGTLLLQSSWDDEVNNPTSTKQKVTSETGLTVLGADPSTGRYLHSVLPLGDSTPAAPATVGAEGAPRPPPSEAVAPAPAAGDLLGHDSFDPWDVGIPVPNGWYAGDEPAGSLVDDESGGKHALLRSVDANALRVCKSVPGVARQQLEVELRVRVDSLGSSDAVLAALWRADGESAAIRVNSRGRLAYVSAAGKIITEMAFDLGRWYRLRMVVDEVSSTYDWQLAADDGTLLVTVSGLSLAGAAEPIERLCLQTSSGAAGLGLAFDDIRIGRQ